MGKTLFCFFAVCGLACRCHGQLESVTVGRRPLEMVEPWVGKPRRRRQHLGGVPGLAGRALLGLGKHRTMGTQGGSVTPLAPDLSRQRSPGQTETSPAKRSDLTAGVQFPSTTSPTPKRRRLRGSCPLPLERKKEVDLDEDFHPLPSEGTGGRTRRPIASSPGPNAQCVSAAAVDKDMASSGVLQVRNWSGAAKRVRRPSRRPLAEPAKKPHIAESPPVPGPCWVGRGIVQWGAVEAMGRRWPLPQLARCASCCLSPLPTPPISTDIAAMGVLGHRPLIPLRELLRT